MCAGQICLQQNSWSEWVGTGDPGLLDISSSSTVGATVHQRPQPVAAWCAHTLSLFLFPFVHLHYPQPQHISRGRSEYANFLGFGTFRQFLQLLLPCANMSSLGGGGGMCILFEICKKTPFQKCMGWGRGGGLPFSSVAQHIGRCTQTWHCTVHPFLFRITVTVSIAFFRQGWDPIRADIPLFVDRDMFLQFYERAPMNFSICPCRRIAQSILCHEFARHPSTRCASPPLPLPPQHRSVSLLNAHFESSANGRKLSSAVAALLLVCF